MSDIQRYVTYTGELEPEPISVFGKVEIVLYTDHVEALRQAREQAKLDTAKWAADSKFVEGYEQGQRDEREKYVDAAQEIAKAYQRGQRDEYARTRADVEAALADGKRSAIAEAVQRVDVVLANWLEMPNEFFVEEIHGAIKGEQA